MLNSLNFWFKLRKIIEIINSLIKLIFISLQRVKIHVVNRNLDLDDLLSFQLLFVTVSLTRLSGRLVQLLQELLINLLQLPQLRAVLWRWSSCAVQTLVIFELVFLWQHSNILKGLLFFQLLNGNFFNFRQYR